MSDIHGRFIWCELTTPSVEGSKDFYGDVVGWTAQDMPMPDMTYTVLQAGGVGVAGLAPTPAYQGDVVLPGGNWRGYVAVDDVDAAAAKARSLGGSLTQPPQDIPGIGRFAIVSDPAGGTIAIMTPAPMEGERPEPPAGAPGTVGWRELMSDDLAKSWAFYEALFGWRKDGEYDMGPMGTYQLFANQDGQVGGMMTRPGHVPAAAWLYYFRVPGIEAAAAKVTAGGGFVTNGPMEVPGGEWVIQGIDPQTMTFALVGKKA